MTIRPLPQPTIGILGGMSDQATGEYYRLINRGLNAHHGGWDNAEIVLVSVNFGNIEHFVRAGLWAEAEAYLAGKVDRLERAGADVVLCVSNTMHRVVAPIMRDRATPFLHIADPTGEAVRAAGLGRVGLLGTRSTMETDALTARLADRHGVACLVPGPEDRGLVDRVIFDELVRGIRSPASKAEYLRVVDDLRRRGAEGVILGCTEIFLLVGADDVPGLPVFDTTALHVDAAVAFASGRAGQRVGGDGGPSAAAKRRGLA